MKEVFNILYPMALRAGIHPIEFWDLTFYEITTVINAFNEQLTYEMRQQAANTYILADLIGISVGRLVDKSVKYPNIDTLYPDLFDPIETKPQQNWLLMKERMIDFAEGRNSAREKR